MSAQPVLGEPSPLPFWVLQYKMKPRGKQMNIFHIFTQWISNTYMLFSLECDNDQYAVLKKLFRPQEQTELTFL